MLFAVADYFRYRFRLGKYSHESMIQEGWLLARNEYFPNWQHSTCGDLIFLSTSGSWLSWMVMYFTNSIVSHVAQFYGDGIVHDCTTSGVIRHPFGDYLDGRSYIRVMPAPLPLRIDKPKLRSTMDKNLGRPYGWRKAFTMFVSINLGVRHEFSWKFAADILTTFAGIAIIFSWHSWLPWVALYGATAYLLVVVVNLARKPFAKSQGG